MKIISIKVTVRSAVLCMGTMDSCPVVPQANEPHANLCMLYTALIDIFVIKLFSYDLQDHTFILQTPASTTPFRLYNG
jgi:hypothetical protein